MQTQVPSSLAPHIVAFCEAIAPSSGLVEIDSAPLPTAEQLDCFMTVERQVAEHGGQRVIGWAIWEIPGVMVEAEFHAVWHNPEGDYLDLTPRPMHFPKILFLPDPSRVYEGRQVDNKRKALIKDQLLTRFIFLMAQRFEFANRGARADQHGVLELTGKAAKEFQRIEDELQKVHQRLFKRLAKAAAN